MPETAESEPGRELMRGDIDALVRLFSRASPMSASHWNPLTGETFAVRKKGQKQRLAAFEERLFEEDGWVEVPYAESDDAFALMDGWAEDLRPGKGRTAIVAALAGDKPFRSFRAAVKRFPGLYRRWQQTEAQEAAVRLVVFCLSQDGRIDDPRFKAIERELADEWDAEERQVGLIRVEGLSLGKGR